MLTRPRHCAAGPPTSRPESVPGVPVAHWASRCNHQSRPDPLPGPREWVCGQRAVTAVWDTGAPAPVLWVLGDECTRPGAGVSFLAPLVLPSGWAGPPPPQALRPNDVPRDESIPRELSGGTPLGLLGGGGSPGSGLRLECPPRGQQAWRGHYRCLLSDVRASGLAPPEAQKAGSAHRRPLSPTLHPFLDPHPSCPFCPLPIDLKNAPSRKGRALRLRGV